MERRSIKLLWLVTLNQLKFLLLEAYVRDRPYVFLALLDHKKCQMWREMPKESMFCWIYWFPTKLCHCSSFRGGRPRIFETDLKNPPFWGYFNTKMPRCQSLSTLRRCAALCRLEHSSNAPVDGGEILYNRLRLCSNFPIIYKAFMIGYITAGDLPDWSAININDLSICSCEPNGTFDLLFFSICCGVHCVL